MVGLRRLSWFGLLGAASACSIDERAVEFIPAGGSAGQASSEDGGAAGQASDEGGSEPRDCRAGAPATELCTPTSPERALITDFSDAKAITDDECNPGIAFAVGDVPGGGQSYIYNSFELEPPEASLAGDEPDERALRIVTVPGVPVNEAQSVVGFGIGWVACIDASEYEGVRFTLRGTLGTCEMLPGVMISQNTIVRLNPAGSCLYEARCAAPRAAPITSEGTHRVRFADTSGGFPLDSVDPGNILGLNWLLFVPIEGPPCEADFTIDDVAFF